jgi:hypothetical protein
MLKRYRSDDFVFRMLCLLESVRRAKCRVSFGLLRTFYINIILFLVRLLRMYIFHVKGVDTLR